MLSARVNAPDLLFWWFTATHISLALWLRAYVLSLHHHRHLNKWLYRSIINISWYLPLVGTNFSFFWMHWCWTLSLYIYNLESVNIWILLPHKVDNFELKSFLLDVCVCVLCMHAVKEIDMTIDKIYTITYYNIRTLWDACRCKKDTHPHIYYCWL